MVTRVIAIDWSGAASGAHKKIWIAQAVGGRLEFLENGRDRDQVAAFLIGRAGAVDRLIIGLDFAFSFPAWFMRERGFTSAHALWARSSVECESWLRECPPPFWGKPGKPKPRAEPQFRRTELNVPATAGIRPKSVFQLGGAGAVGTGSLRGMPLLHRLHDAGFSIWPFDPPGWPRVVEIYPRLLTGAVNKRCQRCRERYLRRHEGSLGGFTETAASSEDSFDAAVSAIEIWRNVCRLERLSVPTDESFRLEGAIWYPEMAV